MWWHGSPGSFVAALPMTEVTDGHVGCLLDDVYLLVLLLSHIVLVSWVGNPIPVTGSG